MTDLLCSIELTHEDCEDCLHALDDARTMAAISGSVGATAIIDNSGVGGVEHKAVYRRVKLVQRDGVPAYVDPDRVIS